MPLDRSRLPLPENHERFIPKHGTIYPVNAFEDTTFQPRSEIVKSYEPGCRASSVIQFFVNK